MLKGGRCSQVTFNSAQVRKPLLAVSSICDKGNVTLSAPTGAWILPMPSEQLKTLLEWVTKVPGKLELERIGGVYHLPASLIPTTEAAKSPFGRQGAGQ